MRTHIVRIAGQNVDLAELPMVEKAWTDGEIPRAKPLAREDLEPLMDPGSLAGKILPMGRISFAGFLRRLSAQAS